MAKQALLSTNAEILSHGGPPAEMCLLAAKASPPRFHRKHLL